MIRPGILVTAPYTSAELAELAEHFTVEYVPWTELGRPRTDDELAALARDAKAEIVVVELDVVGEQTLTLSGLRAVGCCRASTPNIDRDGATAAGIPVFTTPGRNAQAVAEWTIAAMLSVLRNLGESERFVRAGDWPSNTVGQQRPYLRFRGRELAGTTVALLGYGAVPRRISPVLNVLGCRVLAVDPMLDAAAPPEGVEVCDLATAVAECDILSVHLPVIPPTMGLVSAEVLGKLSQGAIVINSSRAAVIDMDALSVLLVAGQIAGVGLDVFKEEPISAEEMSAWNRADAFITPHIAGATYEVERHHSQIMNKAVLDFWAAAEK